MKIAASIDLERRLPTSLRLRVYRLGLDETYYHYFTHIDVKLHCLDSDDSIENNDGVGKAVFIDPLSTYGDVEYVVNMLYEKRGDTYVPVKLADKEVEVRHLEPA